MADDRLGVDGASDVPKVGDCIAGKYRVERSLGAGGMGAVLAAQHLMLGSRVAIKVLLPAAAQLPEAVERFLREARAAAALCGEHVARVLDMGTLDTGMPYLVMEYLAGRDLGKALVGRGPLPVAEAADYLLQACDAMAEAHALGIVHRDSKPANLFLVARPNGSSVLKVLDFGLAKVLDGARTEASDASLTATGVVIGTPHYMPPEQLRGLKFADTRSDIWSLGVIAYQMLVGRRPFVGPDMVSVIAAIAADEPVSPSTLRPDLPASIDAIIMRCLRKNAEMRVQTVQELAAVLEPFAPARSRGSLASVAAIDAGAMAAALGPAPGIAPQAPQLVPLEMARPAAPAPSIARPSNAADHPTMAAGVAAATAPHGRMAPGEAIRDATTLTLGSSEVHAASERRSPRGVWLAAGGAVTAGALAAAAVVVGLRRGEQPQGEPTITLPTNAATGAPGTGDVPALPAAVTPSATVTGSASVVVPGTGDVPGPPVAVAPSATVTGSASVVVPASAGTASGTAGKGRTGPAPTADAQAKPGAPSAPATSKPAASTRPNVPYDPLKGYK